MKQSFHFSPETLSESASILHNPCQGFYHMIRYTLADDDPQELTEDPIREYDLSLVLLEINLRGYRTGAISGSALAQLDGILKAWSKSQIILRFLYDWDGAAKAAEPESLSIILTHMDQVSEVINRYVPSVYLIQGIFIGNWGEMHDSHFMDAQSFQTLITRLHEVIAPSIYLSVRTPAQWRRITGLHQVPAKFPAFQDRPPIAGRLGLYNDGMLGSWSDLGTYEDTPAAPFCKGTREEELSFQNQLCQYVPNGGEVVYDTPYNDLPAAVQYLKTIHAAYLNADYDPRALEKWRRTAWRGQDAFSGCDGLSYIQAHLGYRYTVRRFALQREGFLRPRIRLRLTLENTGFGNALKPFHAAFLLQSTAKTVCLPLPFDFRNFRSGQKATLSASVPVKELPAGAYSLFFFVTDTATGKQIVLANTAYYDEKGLLLGRLEL